MSPQWLLMKLNCVMRRNTAVIAMKEGNIPKTSVVFMSALRALELEARHTVRRQDGEERPNRQLRTATNRVFPNHSG